MEMMFYAVMMLACYQPPGSSTRNVTTKNSYNNNDNNILNTKITIDNLMYVDPEIKNVLISTNRSSPTSPTLIDSDTKCIFWDVFESYTFASCANTTKDKNDNNEANKALDRVPISVLLALAHQSDSIIFHNEERKKNHDNHFNLSSCSCIFPESIQGLLHIAHHTNPNIRNGDEYEARIYMSTLLALNLLEGSIRKITKYEDGRAPLLKDMIDQLSNNSSYPPILSSLLKTLLLPHQGGLNLRNLLWHGFLSSIPRPWLSLVIILYHSIEILSKTTNDSSEGKNIHTQNINTTKLKPMKPENNQNKNQTLLLNAFAPHDNPSRNDSFSLIRKQLSAMTPIIHHGQEILTSSTSLSNLQDLITNQTNFIPISHRVLFRSTTRLFLTSYPICYLAIIVPILEHALRLRWCDVNNREGDKYAKPNMYYVTLDGVGQQEKHDSVLLPYLSTTFVDGDLTKLSSNNSICDMEETPMDCNDQGNLCRNKLISDLGGNNIALLSDLFASPFGPNIRATIAHGLYNESLLNELERITQDNNFECYSDNHPTCLMTTTIQTSESRDEFDLVCAILVAFQSLGERNLRHGQCHDTILKSYRPLFSYTSTMTKSIQNTLTAIFNIQVNIEDRCNDLRDLSNQPNVDLVTKLSSKFITLHIRHNDLRSKTKFMLSQLQLEDTIETTWTVDDIYKEYKSNILFARCTAARLLLDETTEAATALLTNLERGRDDMNDYGNVSSRRRKQIQRLQSIASLYSDLYSLTAFIAILFIQRQIERGTSSGSMDVNMHHDLIADDTLSSAVRRSRMVVSTVSSTNNNDRALKAISEYLNGKFIKDIAKIIHLK